MFLITKSPELVAVTERWLKAQAHKNPEILVGLFSESDHLSYVGTGPNELWTGQYLREGYHLHTKEIPEFVVVTDKIEAFENDSTGWAYWVGTLKFDHIEEPRPLRMTWVYVLERGTWKIVNMHLSTPRSNLETAGHEHFAFAELIDAAKGMSSSLGQEGTATIMFTDIVGSTALNAQVGDQAWAATINNHFSEIRGIVENDGGEVVKSLGDGTMTSFPSVAGALRSSIEVHRMMVKRNKSPRLQVRIGIHTGDVIKTGDDFFGKVVNTAARVAEAATAEQTLVSDAVRGLAPAGEFKFGESIALNIRGIDGASTICALHW